MEAAVNAAMHNIYVVYGIGLGVAILCGSVGRHFLLPMLAQAEALQRPNYQQEQIPLAAGVIFVLAALPVQALLAFLPGQDSAMWLTWIGGGLLGAFLGLLDDIAGNRNDTGLKGHFAALVKEHRLTTGGLKAAGGLFFAVFAAALYNDNIYSFLLGGLAVLLSFNTINIFDLRPGRAGKAFFVFSLLLFGLSMGQGAYFVYLCPTIVTVAVYLPIDLRAQAMMGDTGANALGIALGLTALWSLPLQQMGVYIAILLSIHLVAEKYSWTTIIQKIALLRKIDEWGRNLK